MSLKSGDVIRHWNVVNKNIVILVGGTLLCMCVEREGTLHVSSFVMHICDTFSDTCMWYIKQTFYTRAYLKFLPLNRAAPVS